MTDPGLPLRIDGPAVRTGPRRARVQLCPHACPLSERAFGVSCVPSCHQGGVGPGASRGSLGMLLEEDPTIAECQASFLWWRLSVPHTFFLGEVCGVVGLGLCRGVWYWGGLEDSQLSPLSQVHYPFPPWALDTADA